MPRASSIIKKLNLDEITEKYSVEQEEPIGSGSFGHVYKCRDKLTNELVAIKIYRSFPEDFFDRRSLYREIKILKMLKGLHNNVELKNVITSKDENTYKGIAIVLKYHESSLHNRIQSTQIFSYPQIGYIMHQILNAVSYMHSAKLVHRDLKPQNILVDPDDTITVCDFGLGRSLESLLEPSPSEEEREFLPLTSKFTHYVVTRWYRAPEIILGSEQYDYASDMWSVGCIMAEILLREPLFPAQSSHEQLREILLRLGTPAPADCDWIENRALFEQVKPKENLASNLDTVFRLYHPVVIDLLKKLLTFDPNKRITAKKALTHPFIVSYYKKPANFEMQTMSNHELCLLENYYNFERLTDRCRPSEDLKQLIVECLQQELFEYEARPSLVLMAPSGVRGTIFHDDRSAGSSARVNPNEPHSCTEHSAVEQSKI